MKPIVQPLALWRRKLVFGTLLLAFLVSLPAFIFYAAGYRYDFTSRSNLFTVTGGFYILADAPASEIFIDGIEVTNARTFRSASYIQGLTPGVHRVHVQALGLHTWVKELEVYPHIVTEAESFNLPLVPQVRLVTSYTNTAGSGVILPIASTTEVLHSEASTSPYVVASTSATSSYSINQEFALLEDLFAEKASTTRLIAARENSTTLKSFSFASTTATSSPLPVLATTTIANSNLRLFKREGEVYVDLVDPSSERVPYYFCLGKPKVEEVFLDQDYSDEFAELVPPIETASSAVLCRSEIRIDRKGEEVLGFMFHPTSANLVLLQLISGLYVVEIDDRSWQNSQPVYLGTDLEFIVYRSGIFIKQGTLIFEVLPELVS